MVEESQSQEDPCSQSLSQMGQFPGSGKPIISGLSQSQRSSGGFYTGESAHALTHSIPNTHDASLLIFRACCADISCFIPGRRCPVPDEARQIQSFFQMTHLEQIARTCCYHQTLHEWLRGKDPKHLHGLCTRESDIHTHTHIHIHTNTQPHQYTHARTRKLARTARPRERARAVRTITCTRLRSVYTHTNAQLLLYGTNRLPRDNSFWSRQVWKEKEFTATTYFPCPRLE